ncbi:ketopantoate reductase family protein [Leucobacter ruminantium]|uniref:2-dehydropantoate 2-reductase n=1 Tax=Leucobacter ruminantium TaxID=1289170 RepID=A0A939RTL3_9MICO|nr:2-dehydropantoate 2-reductase [Leucobacter ruminantium]MBO1804500.1 2-dehydropantoate 2-reductase [Leucobacter ruminantium]
MRILIVGAGATGGAFGTLLQEAGRDVTYLVRGRRAAALRQDGLRLIAPSGERTLLVQTLIAGEKAAPFDLVLVAVKAGALEHAITDLREHIDAGTRILPILNGMAHMRRLEEEFPGQVIGGSAKIVATLDGDAVRQMEESASIAIGAMESENLSDLAAVEVIGRVLDVPGIELTVSADIMRVLWEKWVFIAALGAVTCLFGGPIGRIIAAGGHDRIVETLENLEGVAEAAGYAPSVTGHAQAHGILTEPESTLTSSLYRDIEAGHPSEAEHILGDLALQAQALGRPTPMLDLALIRIRTRADG